MFGPLHLHHTLILCVMLTYLQPTGLIADPLQLF